MKTLRCTPIQIVDQIEPNLEFWETRLGYKRTAQVPPSGGPLDFVILERDGLEVMLETRNAIASDITGAGRREDWTGNKTVLYIEVDSLDQALASAKGLPLFMEPIDRPYGMREFGVKDPSGYLVVFAQAIKK